MSLRLPPTDRSPQEWMRKAAGIVNGLIGRLDALEGRPVGSVRYNGGILEHWNGSAWQPIP